MKPNQSPSQPQQPPRQPPSGRRPPRGAPAPADAPPAPPKFLLVKHLPPSFTEADVRGVFIDAQSIAQVFLCPNSRNVYLKFTDPRELRRIVAENEARPLVVNGAAVRMSVVSKLPLDLNARSRVVLITIYHEKVPVDAFTMHAFLQAYGDVLRVAIYKKKSFQALAEFAHPDAAADFVRLADNRHHDGLFFIRAQFTQKDELVVNANTRMEFDFARARQERAPVPRPTLPARVNPQETSAPKPAPRQFGMPKSQQVLSSGPIPERKGQGRPKQASFTSFHEEPKSLSEVSGHNLASGQLSASDYEEAQDWRPKQPAEKRPLRPAPAPTKEKWLTDESKHSSSGSDSRGSKGGKQRPDGPAPSSAVHALLVSNLPPQMGHKQVFNLFSLYGNIQTIKHSAALGKCFVFYRTQLDQVTAFDNLHGVEVFGRRLEVQLEQRWIDDFDRQDFETVAFKLTEQFAPENYAERARSINRPNATLYVFNLTAQVTLPLVRELFEELRPVLQIEYLNSSQNSCLVYFETLEAAASVLALFKNINMLEKGLKINFANEERAAQRMRSPVRRRRLALASASSFGEPRRREAPTMTDPDEDGDWLCEERDVVVEQVLTQAALAKRRFSHLSTASGDKLG